jgi:hypothetical protein
MTMRLGILGVGFLLLGVAHASDVNGKHAVLGTPGNMPCSEFVSKLGDDQTMGEVFGWILGYTTAMNLAMPDTYNYISRPDDFPDLLIKTCSAQPNATIATAVSTILGLLYETRIRQAP